MELAYISHIMRVSPNLNSDSMMKYAKRLYDACTRLFRANPTTEAGAMLQSAMYALQLANSCFAGCDCAREVRTAEELNNAADALNAL